MEYIEQPTLKLLSWNIYRNYKASLVERTLRRHLEEHGPDLLLIQEAPVYEAYQFADLGLFNGYHSLYAPVHEIRVRSARFDFISTGQLILSRHTVHESAVYELPALRSRSGKAFSRRGAVTRNVLYAQLKLASGRTIGVYNIHLENRSMATGRLKQVRHLLDLIRRRDDDLIVVGGDFNTFLTSAFETCLRLFRSEGFTNLFSDARMRLVPRLDYFMVKGAAEARASQLRGGGSDHRPIMATIQM